MITKKIDQLKKGEVFQLSKDSNVLYVKDEFNRSIQKYSAYKYDDMNHFIHKNKGTIVYTEND